MILSVRPLLLSAVLLFSSVVIAATPSDTLEALADWHAGRFPITLSGDGQWLLHADNEGLLQRRRVLPDKTLLNASLRLPDVAQTISTTHDGKQVAVLTAMGCIGIARFENPPSFAWLPGSQAKLQEDARTPSCGSTRAEKNGLGTRRYDESGTIALSADGKLLALGGHPIRIVEAKSGKIMVSIPSGRAGAGYKLLHLSFLDYDRKLLVAVVKDGYVDEGPSLRSDVEFLVWDLQHKTLQNVHQTGTQGLNSYDIFWKFSEHSGKLWAIRTDGRYQLDRAAGEADWKPAPIKPYAINLKQCGAEPAAAMNLPQSRNEIFMPWDDFSADPLGRWIVTAEPKIEMATKRMSSVLRLRSATTGLQLAQWTLPVRVKALQPSADGLQLFGITAGSTVPSDLENVGSWNLHGGGQLMRFDLAPHLKGQIPEPELAWDTQPCRIDNEEAGARQLGVPAKPELLRSLPLDGSDLETCNMLGSGDQRRPGLRWGRTPDDELWLDRCTKLERIDLVSGKLVQTIPTPRNDSVAGFPLYERNQFLVWQGDTVALRPLVPGPSAPARVVLVRKPGWRADTVLWLGDRFFVRWANKAREPAANNGPDTNVGVVYDLQGRVLQTLTEGLDGPSYGVFESDSFYQESATSLDRQWAWSLDAAGSVRAQRLDPATGRYRTTLWAGLNLGTMPPAHIDAYNGSYLFPPVGPVSTVSDGQFVDVYDAEHGKHLLRLKTDPEEGPVIGALWFDRARMLVMQQGEGRELKFYR